MAWKFTKPLVGAALAVVGVVGFAPPANAAAQDGVINSNEFIFYYNSNWKGSISDFVTSHKSLAGFVFISSGAGKGDLVKNNSASVFNVPGDKYARVYFNSDYGGVNDLIPPSTKVQLTNVYNQNASFKWLASA